ncbi:MAG: head-tail adaptor protein, partial [Ruminococcus sp.]|nr:head-tail adaptor protein [Ruminococcus sp.]
AKVRCYREGRHGSARWANLSTFTQATDMFRFRVIPDVTVTPDLYIDYQGERFKILSVENIRGRGMYLEILAEKVESCIG